LNYGQKKFYNIRHKDDRKPVNYYACADLDMTPVVNLPRRSYGMAEVVGLAIIVYVQVRIKMFKKKAEPGPHTVGHQAKPKSLASFNTTIIPMTTLGFIAVYSIKINSLSHLDVNEYPDNLHMQIFQLLVPNLASVMMSMAYYAEHSMLRNALIQTVHEQLRINSVYPVIT